MKAIRIHSTGDPRVMGLEDVPPPEPAEGEIRIRVHAAGVNPVDHKIRSGEFGSGNLRLPMTLGRDVSGVVDAVGSSGDGINVGEPVFAFLGSQSGGYAEYAIAKIKEAAPKPSSIDHVHAAAVPLAATTAWQGLFDHGDLQEGQRVLVHGAAGGVGHFAVQFAKCRGATVVATAAGEDSDFVCSLGANVVIDYQRQRFEDEVGDIDLVLDLISGETQERSWTVLKDGGAIVSTLDEPSREKAATKQARARSFMVEPRGDQLAEIARLIDAGRVSVLVSETLPLSEAARAHAKLEHEHTRGKLVLAVSSA